LSPITVISREETSTTSPRAAASVLIGRSSTARSDGISVACALWMSSTSATSSPCTNSCSFVTITTTECLGSASATDCGTATPLLFWITSTSAE
jgi:hypothetical protein